MTDLKRFCPHCGMRANVEYCLLDGVATFEMTAGDAEAAKLEPGALVAGKYRILRQLGRGGFGAVYEAEHTGGLGKMAIKLLALAQQDEDDVRRFYREAQVTAQLRHANTVRVFDVGQAAGGALFLAMELLRGKSLEEELKERLKQQQVMSQLEAIDVACDVLRSLSEAHASGLVHRDLKPANLMLTEVDGDLLTKVLDFGIAHVQDSSLTGTGRALGTPMYMSPEQCTGGALDARSDLYSLGIILFRCVTGRVPFGDPNPLAIMFAHISQPCPDLYAAARTPINDAFVAVLAKALAKDAAERFASAREMRAALEAAKAQPLILSPEIGAETGEYLPRKAETPHLASGPPSPRGTMAAQVAAQAAKSLGLAPATPLTQAGKQRLVVTIDEPAPADPTEAAMTLEAKTVADPPAVLAPTPRAAALAGLAAPVDHERIGTEVIESVVAPVAAAPAASSDAAERIPAGRITATKAFVAAAALALAAMGWVVVRPASQEADKATAVGTADHRQELARPIPLVAQEPARLAAPAAAPAVPAAAVEGNAAAAAPVELGRPATPEVLPAAPPTEALPATAPAGEAARRSSGAGTKRPAERTKPVKKAPGLDDALPSD